MLRDFSDAGKKIQEAYALEVAAAVAVAASSSSLLSSSSSSLPSIPIQRPSPRLILAGLPGPVRDTLDAFGIDSQVTRFLLAAAAVAYLKETELAAESPEMWDAVTRDTIAFEDFTTVETVTRPPPLPLPPAVVVAVLPVVNKIPAASLPSSGGGYNSYAAWGGLNE